MNLTLKEYKYYDKRRFDVRELAIVFEEEDVNSKSDELAMKADRQIRDNEARLIDKNSQGNFEVFAEFCELLNDKYHLL